jgi:hypothetical protein
MSIRQPDWRNLGGIPDRRFVACSMAPNAELLHSASTPDVPFCAAAASTTVVVLARRSVVFEGASANSALPWCPAELGEPHAGHAVGSGGSNAARPIWRPGRGIVSGRVVRTSSSSRLPMDLCRAARCPKPDPLEGRPGGPYWPISETATTALKCAQEARNQLLPPAVQMERSAFLADSKHSLDRAANGRTRAGLLGCSLAVLMSH